MLTLKCIPLETKTSKRHVCLKCVLKIIIITQIYLSFGTDMYLYTTNSV